MVLVSDIVGGRERHRDAVGEEVVAVRWHCEGCEAATVGAPGTLPLGWVEVPAPPWNQGRAARFGCPDCAAALGERAAKQWSRHADRTYAVSAVEHDRVLGRLRSLVHDVERLKIGGERAAGREIV